MVKQVIVMRKDLNMRKGKMIAQGAHASMKIFFDRARFSVTSPFTSVGDHFTEITSLEVYYLTPEMEEWIRGSFTKIVLSVNSLEELLDIKNQAEKLGLPVAIIEDNGLTEFKGIRTVTCLAIGPADSSVIDSITGLLPLL